MEITIILSTGKEIKLTPNELQELFGESQPLPCHYPIYNIPPQPYVYPQWPYPNVTCGVVI